MKTPPPLARHKIADESFLETCTAKIRETYTWWTQLPRIEDLPSKSFIAPDKIVSLLPIVCLVDVTGSPDDWYYRLVGTELVYNRGGEVTGKRVRDGYHGTDWEDVHENYSYVKETRSFLYDPADLPTPWGGMRSNDTLFLPFCNDKNDLTIVLVASVNR